MVDDYSNVKLALISKYDTSVWPRLVRWLFYTNVDSNVQLKVTATAVIIRKRGWFSRIPFLVLLCAFYNHSDAFFNADDLLTDTTTNKNKPILYYFFCCHPYFSTKMEYLWKCHFANINIGTWYNESPLYKIP